MAGWREGAACGGMFVELREKNEMVVILMVAGFPRKKKPRDVKVVRPVPLARHGTFLSHHVHPHPTQGT